MSVRVGQEVVRMVLRVPIPWWVSQPHLLAKGVEVCGHFSWQVSSNTVGEWFVLHLRGYWERRHSTDGAAFAMRLVVNKTTPYACLTIKSALHLNWCPSKPQCVH